MNLPMVSFTFDYVDDDQSINTDTVEFTTLDDAQQFLDELNSSGLLVGLPYMWDEQPAA